MVPEFDDSCPLIIFDGMCVLCSKGIQWTLARDPHGTSYHAVIQDPVPRALYEHYGLDADGFDTFMVLARGKPYIKWAGVLATARTMPAPWRWLGNIGRVVPSALADPVYDWVQRNRIRWFGSRETCFLPDPSQKGRFLPTNQG